MHVDKSYKKDKDVILTAFSLKNPRPSHQLDMSFLLMNQTSQN